MTAVTETREESITVRLFRVVSQQGKLIQGYQEAGTREPSEGRVLRLTWFAKSALERLGNPQMVEVTVRAVPQQGSAVV